MFNPTPVDTLKFFQADKITSSKKNNYVEKIITEVKNYGFAYIPNNKKMVEKIRKTYPDLKINVNEDSALLSE